MIQHLLVVLNRNSTFKNMHPVLKYFTGEKAESYLFLIVGVIALAVALYFNFILKTLFWKGVSIPFIIVAILEIIVGYTIVTRTQKDIQRVEFYINSASQNIEKLEIPRMKIVMSNFKIFRTIEIVFILLGLTLMYSSMNDTFLRGIGLGLFIQSCIVLSLDFFAEKRGYIYMEYLKDLSEKI